MKSTEVYASLKDRLSPVLKPLGFKREKTLLSWSRRHNDLYTVLWCQISRNGWDAYAGSQFVVEFQRSAKPEVGSPALVRERLNKFLLQVERDEVRRLQNSIIGSLTRPPSNYPTLNISPDVSTWYLAAFSPVERPYSELDDVWFRYASPDHVRVWGDFLAKLLPECVQRIEDRR